MSEAALRTDVRVERLRFADLDRLSQIESQSFSQPWTREQLGGVIGDPAILALGSRSAAGELTGYAIGYLGDVAFHLATLAIAATHRERGCGSLLLRETLSRAREKGCRRCTLEVRRQNHSARRLYVRNGFATYDIRWNYYSDPNDPALLMRKTLV